MSNHLAPFHFDIVGSFLRPAELKKKHVKAFYRWQNQSRRFNSRRRSLLLQTLSKQKAQVYL